ncbi:MAG: hypothetical protein CME70_02210 [Halobacteriovorax sp.]|nr:hypothetical protein [Halobacteriovorax sp.]|tara:strand:- start:55976 stop:57175 length:1200 start_codon:yes stop_codon:yes gene_type:complete
MMNQNLKNMLCAELSQTGAYIDRLFHALFEVGDAGQNKDFKHDLLVKVEQLNDQFARTFLSQDCSQNSLEIESSASARVAVDRIFTALPLLLNSVGNHSPWVEKTTTFINSSYQLAFHMHKFLKDTTEIDVQLPRLNILEMEEIPAITKEKKENYTKSSLTLIHTDFTDEEEEEEEFSYQLFTLPLESVKEFGFTKNGMLSSLIQQRKKKYSELLHAGHQAIFDKEFHKALNLFNRALNYVETAEVLTLLGWTYSLMEDLEQAKSYCLRAIQVDENYGPPYNDLGTYLLNDGQIDESLKWFDLAKKAINYQNREYPYINAGRAWMLKKNLTRALDEFSKALSLAPYNEELHSTVEKLKKSIHKSTDKINQAALLNKPKLPPTLQTIDGNREQENPGSLN